MRTTRIARQMLASAVLFAACGRAPENASKHRAIEAALTPLGQLDVQTGSNLNIGGSAIAGFRRLEAAGLVKIKDVPQGYWDNFASQTFMEGTRPYTIVPTHKLNEIAINPRWSTPANAVDLSREKIVETLESSWNFYVRTKIFLGVNCFGGATSFARSDGPCALELTSEYPTYQALAAKGLITLEEMSVPPSAVPSYLSNVAIDRAARVALTPAGTGLAEVDAKTDTATFVFGTYRVEEVLKNTPITASDGTYRLVEGTHVFDLRPEFKDLWAGLGKDAYRERKFRDVFTYDPKAKTWSVAIASNGRYSAEDAGPRNGGFDSENVPPTVESLLFKSSNGAPDNYTWHIRLGELKVGEVLRDEDYKGSLATPGETFRLVLATIRTVPASGATALPAELTRLLPGRLRCIVKYSDFDKAWRVVALDVAPAASEQWSSSNVR